MRKGSYYSRSPYVWSDAPLARTRSRPTPQPTPPSPSDSLPGAAPQPTPTAPADSQSDTVEQITDRLAADLASDPPGWPSRTDYELVVLPFYDDSSDSIDDALADFDHYAAVYVAAECLAGRETTPAGFRDLVGRTFSAGRDRIPRIAAEAETAIASILAHEPQDARRHACAPTSPRPRQSKLLRPCACPAQSSPPTGPTCCPGRSTPRLARDSPLLVRPPRHPLPVGLLPRPHLQPPHPSLIQHPKANVPIPSSCPKKWT